MRRHVGFRGVMLVLAIALGAMTLGGCKAPPPALTKAELDAGKMSEKHPKVPENFEGGCRGCHKEQPPIKQP